MHECMCVHTRRHTHYPACATLTKDSARCPRHHVLPIIQLANIFTNICPTNAGMTLDVHVVSQGKQNLTNTFQIFFFFFFAFPSYLWGSPLLGEIFCVCDHFFLNPTIKVVTVRLRGWCVLGVFFLPAFTRPGHEHQDLLSPCDEMHVCTD